MANKVAQTPDSTANIIAAEENPEVVEENPWGPIIRLPIIVAIVAAGWIIWRLVAPLDEIEQRQLAWPVLGRLLLEHLQLMAVSIVIILATAIPLGIVLTRRTTRKFSVPAVAIANIGQAAPSIGLIVLFAIWMGFGFWPAIVALSVYGFLPVLANTITGLNGVDRSLLEASRGMGRSAIQTLFRVELPLAAPVIMTGVRTALVLVVGTAAFGTFVNAGGLGALITTGVNLFRFKITVSGAIIIALLALLVDWVGRVLEMLWTPKGMR